MFGHCIRTCRFQCTLLWAISAHLIGLQWSTGHLFIIMKFLIALMCLFLYSVYKVLKEKSVYIHTQHTHTCIDTSDSISAWNMGKYILCTENIVTIKENIFRMDMTLSLL